MSRFTLSRIPSLRPRQAGVGSVTPPSLRGRRLPPRATRWPLAKAGAPSVVAVPSERRAGPSGRRRRLARCLLRLSPCKPNSASCSDGARRGYLSPSRVSSSPMASWFPQLSLTC